MWLNIDKKSDGSGKQVKITYNRNVVLMLNLVIVILAAILVLYLFGSSLAPDKLLETIFPKTDMSEVFLQKPNPDYASAALLVLASLAVFNIVVLSARVVISKKTDGTIEVRKRSFIKEKVVSYRPEENPELKFIKYSALGDLLLAMESLGKRTLIYPNASVDYNAVAKGGNRWKFSKEEAADLANTLGIRLSDKVGGYSESFDEIN